MTVHGKVHVDGVIEGKIDANDDISIGKHGQVTGLVKARHVHVSGCLEGEVICDVLFVEAGGQVRARVLSRKMSVDPRGCFQGERREQIQQVLALQEAPEKAFEFGVEAIDSLPDRIVLGSGRGKYGGK
ncbi:bactofilin family protein [Marinobacterium rhizophilum]|uniref:bactofilin family protein n=1 Tax=Marinobacterium rhizophilum TaxID=420402 RepID=UPI00035F76C6|nr:polymer-forming cytoskeletal protein [Marinobacterium rhizophilum]